MSKVIQGFVLLLFLCMSKIFGDIESEFFANEQGFNELTTPEYFSTMSKSPSQHPHILKVETPIRKNTPIIIKSYSTIDSLNQYLEQNGYNDIEGHMCSIRSDQPDFFDNLIKTNSNIHIIGEIGFNAGHSSVIFLKARPNTIVFSFDLMNHEYTKYGKNFIDQVFPSRHVLIEGDSMQSVPLFQLKYPNIQFDLIFIDGGHGYYNVFNDIQNMRKYAHKDTIVILDDAFLGMDPDKACTDLEAKGLIKKIQFYQSAYDLKDWPRAWLVCKYMFDKE